MSDSIGRYSLTISRTGQPDIIPDKNGKFVFHAEAVRRLADAETNRLKGERVSYKMGFRDGLRKAASWEEEADASV